MIRYRLLAARCAVVLLGVVSMLVPATGAYADPDPAQNWSIAPANTTGPDGRPLFDLSGAPGQQFADHVTVANLGSAPLVVTVYPTDALTTPDGAYGLLTADRTPSDVGSWTDLKKQQFTIEPHKQFIVPFRLTIPAGARPGDHAGGIVASVEGQQTQADGNQVKIDRRIATRLYVRVAGQYRASAEISRVSVEYRHPGNPFASGSAEVTYVIHNNGNIRFHGTARVRLQALFGIGLAQAEPVTVPDLLPGAEVTVTAKLTGIAPVGRLTAAITLDPVSADGNLPTTSRSASGWASPWLPLSGIALVVLLVVAALWLRSRRRRRPAPPVRPSRPRTPAAVG